MTSNVLVQAQGLETEGFIAVMDSTTLSTATSTGQPPRIDSHNPSAATPRVSVDVYSALAQHEKQQQQQRLQAQQQIAANMSKRVHREIRFGSYILGSTLGEGEFGKVKLGWRKDGKVPSQVAIKLIKRSTIVKDSDSEIKINREINSLKLLNHPNIVNLVEVMKSGKYIGIVLEYASGGELFDYILHNKYLKEPMAKKLFSQLVSGVDYMHSKGLIHRDLKLENLLLDKHQNVIISDFGFVNSYNRDKNDFMKTSCGSPCYAAPELVLTQSQYEGRKVDLWSLGVILYAMLAGYLPFDDDPENEDGSDIVRLYHYICKTPLTFPEYISPLARDLLRKLIVPDPKKRISMDEVKNHPWLIAHSKLLSIKQPEWDRIHKENEAKRAQSIGNQPQQQQPQQQQQQQQQPAYDKRYSMVPEMSNSSSLLLSQTSHQHTKLVQPTPTHTRSYSSNSISLLYSPPSTSSSLANAMAIPPMQTNSIIPPDSSTTNSPATAMFQTPSPKRSRTSSSPTKGHQKSASISNSYSSASFALKAVYNDSTDSFTTNNYQPHHGHVFSSSQIPRSTTYTNTSISTIVESPTKVNTDGGTRGAVPGSIGLPPLSHSSNATKLPHTTKKPRPTSYHPSSMSSAFNNSNNSNNSHEFIKMPQPTSVPIAQYISTSPPKSEHSPTKDVPSRRNSVVTHLNVNGVLSNQSSAILSNSPNVKRNSMVLSYLEDKIDTLELTDSHSPTKEAHVIAEYEKENVKEEPQTTEKSSETDDVVVENDAKMTRESTPQSHPASPPTDNELVEPIVPIEEYIEKPKEEEHRPQPTIVEEQDTPQVKPSLERRHTIASRKQGEDKENREQQKKRNRFSILSFYSTPSSSTSLNGKEPRKVLEPLNDTRKEITRASSMQKRINSNSSHASKRTTMSTSTTNSSASGKEASAARKVMDFFKRRSIRA
ncbi:Serine/threonine-protein kinase KIN4 [Spathaspora sp. JA1]|nr:Serine/threonine-protein kinase KIN4 [Spathaspora sp. JA1]